MTPDEIEVEAARRRKAVARTRAWEAAHPEHVLARKIARQRKAAEYKYEMAELKRKAKAMKEGDIAACDPSMDQIL